VANHTILLVGLAELLLSLNHTFLLFGLAVFGSSVRSLASPFRISYGSAGRLTERRCSLHRPCSGFPPPNILRIVIRLKDSRRRFFLFNNVLHFLFRKRRVVVLTSVLYLVLRQRQGCCRRGLWNLFELIFARAFSEYSGQTWLNRSFCDDGVILRTRLFSISSLLLSYRDSFSFHIQINI
jgi:hypothetical protein